MSRPIALFLAILVVLQLVAPVVAWAKPIKVTRVSDLVFGNAVQGDPPRTILPSTIETPDNASFLVTGDANVAYTVTLPVASVDLKGPGNGGKEIIAVGSFQSFPPSGSTALDASGQAMLYVGATRGAILLTQGPGSYIGSFLVTVVY